MLDGLRLRGLTDRKRCRLRVMAILLLALLLVPAPAPITWGRAAETGIDAARSFPADAGAAAVAIGASSLASKALLTSSSATPAASPVTRSFVWDTVDVTVQLREDSSLHIVERLTVDFQGGPFRYGYREIPLGLVESLDAMRVAEVNGEAITPFRFVTPQQFSPAMPNTYTNEVVGTNMRIDWSFPPVTSQRRTFELSYDVTGGLRVYADAQPPYQEISWIGVGRELTETAPVRGASLTIILPRPVNPDETMLYGPGGGLPADHTADGQTWVWRASDLEAGDSLQATLRFAPLVAASKPAWQDASDRQEQEATPAAPLATPIAGLTCRQAVQSDAAAQTRTLVADCTTDRSLFVPDGWTFDGNGHTIFAVDPDAGFLRGGILMVTGVAGDVRDVTIDGAGLATSCADDNGASELAGVLYRGAAGTISGVQVRNMARSVPLAETAGNEPTTSHRASCGTGIAVKGGSARVFIEQNRIENVQFVGISIEAGEASVSGNTIDRAYGGILAASGAHVRISPENSIRSGAFGILFEDAGTSGRIAGNTIRTMSRIGVSVIDGAQAAIAGNAIFDIDVNGIAIEGSNARATVETNQIERAGAGIKVYQGSAEIRGNDVASGIYGIVASGGATARIAANTLTNQTDTGIYILHQGTDATVEQNVVEDAQSDGIWVEQQAHAAITGNQVSRAARIGIAAVAGAEVTIAEGNQVSGGRFGISVIGTGTVATVEANTVSEVAQTGYSVESGATGHLRQNRAREVDWGILITGESTTADLIENRIERTTSAGIVLDAGSQTTAAANQVLSPGANGIWITGTGTTATVRASDITGATGSGIKIDSGAGATIENGNHITDSTWGMAILGDGTTATVTGNTVEGVALHGTGVRIGNGARALVTENAIEGSITGVFVLDAGSAVVERNTIRDSANTAIWFEQTAPRAAAATDAIRGNVLDGGHNGIAVSGAGATMAIAENRITDVESTGISIENGAASLLRMNVITRAGASGIVAGGAGTTITLEGNSVSDAEKIGISVERGAQATIAERNQVDGAKWGIAILGDGTTAEVRGNRVRHATNQGISVGYGARATIDGNNVSGGHDGIDVRNPESSAIVVGNFVSNALNGIAVRDGATAERIAENSIWESDIGIVIEGAGTSATIADNRIRGSRTDGLQFAADTRGSVHGNEISDSGLAGIRVLDAIKVDVRENTVRDPGIDGISVSGGRVTIAGNTISGASANGMQLGGDAAVEVTGNTILGPGDMDKASGPSGIAVIDTVHGAITNNAISRHANVTQDGTGCGIAVGNGVTHLTIAENHFPDPGNEQDICDQRLPAAATPLATPVAAARCHSGACQRSPLSRRQTQDVVVVQATNR